MIGKIMKSQSMSGVMNYNIRKVEQGTASIVATGNLPDDDYITIKDTFDRYEKVNNRTVNPSFHLVFNPDDTEDAPTEKMIAYIAEVMKELGYGKQPYTVFQHNDNDRQHFHVISIRTDENGRKINDSFEKKKIHETIKKLERKYGFKDGKGQSEENKDVISSQLQNMEKARRKHVRAEYFEADPEPLTAQTQQTTNNPKPVQKAEKFAENLTRFRFDPKIGNLSGQIAIAFEEAIKYNYKTFNQFKSIMASMGIAVMESGEENKKFTFQGLGPDGDGTTKLYRETEDTLPYHALYERKKQLNEQEPMDLRLEKNRIAGITSACLPHSRSEQHLKRMLEKKGIFFTLSRNPEGRIFGATFIDATTNTVLKCSELGKRLELSKIAACEENGQWTKEPVPRKSPKTTLPANAYGYDLRNRSASQQMARRILRSSATMMEALITMLAPPKNKQKQPKPTYKLTGKKR